MALTTANAFGRLEIDYTAYGKPHAFRVWVPEFGNDSGVGTFSAGGTPASLDALATQISGVMKGIFNTGSALSFGAWRGLLTTVPSTGAGIVIVEGTTTPGSGTLNTADNPAEAVSEGTFTFRDSGNHLVKHVFLGTNYGGPGRVFYSTLPTAHKAWVDYVLGSNRVLARSGFPISSFASLSWDTNDGLTRRYRR